MGMLKNAEIQNKIAVIMSSIPRIFIIMIIYYYTCLKSLAKRPRPAHDLHLALSYFYLVLEANPSESKSSP